MMPRTHNQDFHGGDSTPQWLYKLNSEFQWVTKVSTKNEGTDVQNGTPLASALILPENSEAEKSSVLLLISNSQDLEGQTHEHTRVYTQTHMDPHTIREPLRESTEKTQTPQQKGDLVPQRSNHGIGSPALNQARTESKQRVFYSVMCF